MQFEDVRRELLRQWTYTGGPNEDKASEPDLDAESFFNLPDSDEDVDDRNEKSR